MKVTQRITPAVLAAATGMLQPFVPDLSPLALVKALKSHEAATGTAPATVTARPLTRKQAAALLSVSLNTITRYLNDGTLQRIRLGRRLVRIAPESINALLHSGATEANHE